MTDIELPPLPEKEQLANPYAHSFGSVTAYGHTDDTLYEYARAYAALATAAKDAEIERLRAERDALLEALQQLFKAAYFGFVTSIELGRAEAAIAKATGLYTEDDIND